MWIELSLSESVYFGHVYVPSCPLDFKSKLFAEQRVKLRPQDVYFKALTHIIAYFLHFLCSGQDDCPQLIYECLLSFSLRFRNKNSLSFFHYVCFFPPFCFLLRWFPSLHLTLTYIALYFPDYIKVKHISHFFLFLILIFVSCLHNIRVIYFPSQSFNAILIWKRVYSDFLKKRIKITKG